MLADKFNALTEQEVEAIVKELRNTPDSFAMTPENIQKFVNNKDLHLYCIQMLEEDILPISIFLSGLLIGIEFADKLMDKSLEKEFKRKMK